MSVKSSGTNRVDLGDFLANDPDLSRTERSMRRNRRNARFREFSQLFEDLTVSRRFETDELEILEVIISASATHFLALVKDDRDTLFRIQVYTTHDMRPATHLDITGSLINAENID